MKDAIDAAQLCLNWGNDCSRGLSRGAGARVKVFQFWRAQPHHRPPLHKIVVTKDIMRWAATHLSRLSTLIDCNAQRQADSE
jgi:hypothetical protein